MVETPPQAETPPRSHDKTLEDAHENLDQLTEQLDMIHATYLNREIRRLKQLNRWLSIFDMALGLLQLWLTRETVRMEREQRSEREQRQKPP